MGDEAAFLANVHIRLRFHKSGFCECSGSLSWLHHDPLFGLLARTSFIYPVSLLEELEW